MVEKNVRIVPEVRNLTQELVAIGRIESAEGKVLVDTGAQVSLIKRNASSAPLAKPDVILRGMSGRELKVYGKQRVALELKPGVSVPGEYIVGNLPRGYLAVIGCDILQQGAGYIDIKRGVLRIFGKEIWLNRLLKGESVPDPRREATEPGPELEPAPKSPSSDRETIKNPATPREPFVYNYTKVVLPPRCEKNIEVRLNKFLVPMGSLEGMDVVAEPVEIQQKGVFLARTLTKVRSQRCWVRVANVSGEEVTLEKNIKVGVLDTEPYCEPDEERGRRKIVILADSHGRGLQEIISERLPRDIDVSVVFLPNGKMKNMAALGRTTIPTLTSRDTVVLIGGTNDVTDRSAPYPLTLQQAFHAWPETWSAKLVVLSILPRHDVELKSELVDANRLLKAIVANLAGRTKGHVEFLEIHDEFERSMYTRHGLHLNDNGKLKLASILRVKALDGYSTPSVNVRRVETVDEGELETCLDAKLEHLSPEKRDEVKAVLLEFRTTLAHSDQQPLGCTSAVKHVIRTGDVPPIYKKAYRVPHHQKAVLDKLIQDQLDQGIIVPSQSAWASPVVLVPKKSPDGTPKLRFCVDYRALNAVTTSDVYPLPNITETLDSLGGCKMFTTLDLRSGYHQIQVDEESRPKTAFNVPGGHYEYQRMPFGLSTAPATFQRLMDSVLMGLKGDKCLVYLDDIILFSKDWSSHLEAIRGVFSKLQSVNLTVQLSKCNFVVDRVGYLGHVITSRGVEPDPGKIKAVQEFPVPKTVTEVRSFLGLSGYYRRFIDGYAVIGQPLFELTKQGQKFDWTPACQTAFDQLKEKLISAPVLVYPDFSKPFILATDASTFALGAVLSQEVDGQEHPVAYCSRTLFPAEKNYSTTELELLSLVWSTKYFRCYLIGRPFKVITDHSALRWMLSLKDPSSRLMRWALRLSEFTYTVEHKPGKKHTNADGLSRAVCNAVRRDELPVMDLATIREHQKRDPHCKDLQRAKSFRMSPEKILYRVCQGSNCIVVPPSLTQEVMRLHHDLPTAGHAGASKTLERIKAKFWWTKMDKDVLEYVKTCRSCSQRTNYGKSKAPLGEIFNEPREPFEVIAADLVGPLPISESRNVYILSVMDHFSRYCEFIPLPDQTAESVARALVQRLITKFGVPKALITDQGANFTSELISQLCRFLHVRKIQTTGFHPQSNGRLERVHATIARMLSHFVNRHQTDWDEYLPYVTMAYNSHSHESTGFSPFEMVFGRKMETPLEADLTITEESDLYSDHVEALRTKLKETFEVAAQRKATARGRYERNYNRKSKEVEYREGQLVWLHVPSLRRHRVKKLAKLWKGPYKILRVLSPLNVILKIRRREVTVHVNRIKPHLRRAPAAPQTQEDPNVELEAEGLTMGEESRDEEQEPAIAPSTGLGETKRVRKKPTYLADYTQ